ncbi:MogA/MoaB family molybdenum cofactor biosynthesis protein [Desulfoplanes formicivorans]|uniref:Molybdopterin adenylyltransferase n=1 Tax=Desulfoplanes formicivorans TaxID=1592317 RepID=A0A194AHU7_9BACT|nr:MogA/MoaB family molybdenum cofactor biosynthesis protein [Desulfoplanes formicivorans]GAU08646.1 molybdenum cofactor biosynthesis protein [Desulfoplanes formicivorans]
MRTTLVEPPFSTCQGTPQRLLLAEEPLDHPGPTLLGTREIHRMRAGDLLGRDTSPLLQAVARIWNPTPDGRSVAAWIMQCLEHTLPRDEALHWLPRARSLAWITLSDKGSQGKREDASGPIIEDQVRETMELSLARGFLIPDSPTRLRALLTDLALFQGFDLILTTGGTGVGPRDITPETTLAVIDKRLPGFEHAMTAASLAKTPMGVISRAVAGTLGSSLIINLPGSPKAVRENLAAILPAIGHTLDKLQGDPRDCASLFAS